MHKNPPIRSMGGRKGTLVSRRATTAATRGIRPARSEKKSAAISMQATRSLRPRSHARTARMPTIANAITATPTATPFKSLFILCRWAIK